MCSTTHAEGCKEVAEYVETRNHTGRRIWVVRVSWSMCGKFVSDTVDEGSVEQGPFPEPHPTWAEVVVGGLGLPSKLEQRLREAAARVQEEEKRLENEPRTPWRDIMDIMIGDE